MNIAETGNGNARGRASMFLLFFCSVIRDDECLCVFVCARLCLCRFRERQELNILFYDDVM